MSDTTYLDAAITLLRNIAQGETLDAAASAKDFLQHYAMNIESPSPSPSMAMVPHDDTGIAAILHVHGISETTLDAIAQEMQVQKEKFGMTHIKKQSLPGHLLVLRHLLDRAEKSWISGGEARDSAQGQLVKVAAVSLHAVNNEVNRAFASKQASLSLDN